MVESKSAVQPSCLEVVAKAFEPINPLNMARKLARACGVSGPRSHPRAPRAPPNAIPVEAEFVYLAVAFSRRVIGWALDRREPSDLNPSGAQVSSSIT